LFVTRKAAMWVIISTVDVSAPYFIHIAANITSPYNILVLFYTQIWKCTQKSSFSGRS